MSLCGSGNLFGTDGIRGVANETLTWDTAFKLGRAVGIYLAGGRKVCVGKDTRASGDMLEASLVAGITSTGTDVVTLGVITTPGLSYLVRKLGFGAGVMISASHNPAQYNGLKVFGPDGKKIPDETEEFISRFILEGPDRGPWPTGRNIGRVMEGSSFVDQYVEFLCRIPAHRLSGLRVALDAANGSTSRIARMVWEALSADVSVYNCEPDGHNINDGCGSTHIDTLMSYVAGSHFDAGFAYDGDGDRCVGVDERGQEADGDRLIAILALDMAERGALAKNTVVGTVMSNLGLELCLRRRGLDLVRTPVGDRFVLERMEREGFNLGGEQSGHIIVRDILPAGDGLVTSLLVADIMVSKGKSLSELGSVMEKVPQVLVNVPASNPRAVVELESVQAAVLSVQKDLGDEGRVIVRPSGTEPVVRIMVEATDPDKVARSIDYLKEVISTGNCVTGKG